MKSAIASTLLAVSALALSGCQKAEEEFPPVEDLGVEDGSSQDLPELEQAEAAKAQPTPPATDEPTDDGGSQDDYDAAGEHYTDEPTDDGGSQDDYDAAGRP